MSAIQVAPSLSHHGATTGAVLGDRLYVVGGSRSAYHHVGDVRLVSARGASFEDPRVPALDRPRGDLVAVAHAGTDSILAVGGVVATDHCDQPSNEPSREMNRLDVRTGTWSRCAPLPAPRAKAGVAMLGDRMLVIGGRQDDLDSASMFAYHVLDDRWEWIGLFPFGARHAAACAFGDRVWYVGGWTAGSGAGTLRAGCYSYDPADREVRRHADLPVPRAGHALVVHRGALHVLGGVDERKQPTRTVFRYDAARDRWQQLAPLVTDRAMFAAGSLGGAIVVAGGWRKAPGEANGSAERHVPAAARAARALTASPTAPRTSRGSRPARPSDRRAS